MPTLVKLKGLIQTVVLFIATNPDIPSPLPIPTPTFAQIGQTVKDSFTLSNSGMVNFINDQPKYLIYAVNASTPVNAGQNCFILDTSRFSVTAQVELPLYGTANIFTIKDTIPFSLSSDSASSGGGESESEIDLTAVTLKSIIKNEFPMDIRIQMYMLSNTGLVLDSLLPANTMIPSSIVNVAGFTTLPGILNTEIVFDKTRTTRLKEAEKIVVKAQATTINNATQNVKFLSTYQLKVKIGVKVKAKVN